MEAGGARGRAYLGGVVDWGYPILTRHAIRWISRFGQKKEAGLGPGLNLKPHETVTSRCGAALTCISQSRWLIVGEMARCAVSESCAVVDTKGEYRRAHRDSVERVIIFDASARISGQWR